MNHITIPLRGGVKLISQVPWAFDCLRWILEAGYRRHRDLLTHHFRQSPLRVLDCGCGTGIHSSFFPADTYVGIDISPTYVDRARSCFPHHCFKVMDATQLEFPDSTFDAVIVSGVVHHLGTASTHVVLKEINRVLQPNGSLLLWEDVPTRDPLNLIGRIIHCLDVGEHIRNESEYAKLLSKYFRIESSESFRSGFMDYAAFRARSLTHSEFEIGS